MTDDAFNALYKLLAGRLSLVKTFNLQIFLSSSLSIFLYFLCLTQLFFEFKGKSNLMRSSL